MQHEANRKPTEQTAYSPELVEGCEVEVRPHDTDLVIAGKFRRYVEGWPEVQFNDRSTCICRPSSVRAILSELDGPKSDPLVEALNQSLDRQSPFGADEAESLRSEVIRLGGRIVFDGEPS